VKHFTRRSPAAVAGKADRSALYVSNSRPACAELLTMAIPDVEISAVRFIVYSTLCIHQMAPTAMVQEMEV